MRRPLRRAAVLGAGTMGAQIAALFANAGIPVLLLDVVPAELTGDEAWRGLSSTSREVRTRVARAGLERARQMQPAAFSASERASLVTVGNFEDDLGGIAECQWVIEAIVEDLGAKQALLERVERHWTPGTIISTNTSGLPIHRIAEGRPAGVLAHFLGTHFFNPPRYLRLLELTPTPHTDPETLRWVAHAAARVLGKSIVYAKDTPNFIANRIGTFGFLHTVRVMLEEGLTIDEVDELTGPVLGRPRSATFRTADLVGLDVLAHLTRNSYDLLQGDEQRETFRLPEFVQEMVRRGWLGEKSGGGFYRRRDGEILVLDPASLEYRPRRELRLPSVDAARSVPDLGRRVKAILAAGDQAARFLWRTLSGVLVYAARRVPEISDDIADVDRATRWGFGWEAGPFETWDALGVAEVAARLQQEQRELPRPVRDVLAGGVGAFYRRHNGALEAFDPSSRAYRPVTWPEGVIALAERRSRGVVVTNPGASLLDLGDGVGCLELHGKLNLIGEDIISMIDRALREAEARFDALVIGTEGRDFSAGANLMLLLMAAQDQDWEELGRAVQAFQRVAQAVRYSPTPVVAAPLGRVLGGGCEIVLHAARVQAAMETYMGFVETAVGLIPAGGGTTQMALRISERIPDDVPADLYPLARWAFENIALARVATSADDCRRLGYLRDGDGISMGPDLLIADAKRAALALAETGYRPPVPRAFRVGGERVRAALHAGLYNLKVGGHISEYDEQIGRRLAYVITGGDVPENARVTEAHLHELEREAFLSLLGERKTQERIKHMLDRGRPLRN